MAPETTPPKMIQHVPNTLRINAPRRPPARPLMAKCNETHYDVHWLLLPMLFSFRSVQEHLREPQEDPKAAFMRPPKRPDNSPRRPEIATNGLRDSSKTPPGFPPDTSPSLFGTSWYNHRALDGPEIPDGPPRCPNKPPDGSPPSLHEGGGSGSGRSELVH